MTFRICRDADCERPADSARGMCSLHYQRWRGDRHVPQAQQFALVLKDAMSKAGIGNKELAERLGLHPGYVNLMRRGVRSPAHGLAVRLSNTLDDARLVTISAAMRSGVCTVCGRTFISMSSKPRRLYCSPKCCNAGQARRERLGRQKTEHVARFRLTAAQRAIAEFCRSCEPVDLACHDAGGDGTGTCPLLPHSPYRFIPINDIRRKAA